MCKFCEVDELTNEGQRKLRKNQRMTVFIGTNMLDKNIYYLEIKPTRMTGECISISYCPICGRKLGDGKGVIKWTKNF